MAWSLADFESAFEASNAKATEIAERERREREEQRKAAAEQRKREEEATQARLYEAERRRQIAAQRGDTPELNPALLFVGRAIYEVGPYVVVAALAGALLYLLLTPDAEEVQ